MELFWHVEWRSPNADGLKVFKSTAYRDRDRMIAAVTEMLARPEVTQLSVVELPTEQCEKCGGILPNCECTYS